MIEIIPNWHPIWVHFAVALLSTAAILFLIFGWRTSQTTGRTNALIVARWTLRLGVIAAFGALLTGYFASNNLCEKCSDACRECSVVATNCTQCINLKIANAQCA